MFDRFVSVWSLRRGSSKGHFCVSGAGLDLGRSLGSDQRSKTCPYSAVPRSINPLEVGKG